MQQVSQLVVKCKEHNEKILACQVLESGQNKFYCLKCFMSQQQSIEELSNQLRNLRQNKIKRLTEEQNQSEKRLDQLKKIFTTLKDRFDFEINSIFQIIENGKAELAKIIQEQIDPLTKSIQSLTLTDVDRHIHELKKDTLFLTYNQCWKHDLQIRAKTIKSSSLLVKSLYQLSQLQQVWKQEEYFKIAEAFSENANEMELSYSSCKLDQYQLISEKVGIYNCWSLTMSNGNEKTLVNGQKNNIQLQSYQGSGSLSLKYVLKEHSDKVSCLCLSRKENNWFISGSWDKTLKIFHQQQNKEWTVQQILQGHQHWVNNIILHNDEDEFISCSYDKTMKIWMKTARRSLWELKQTLSELNDVVFHLSFTPNGTMFASCGNDKLRLWVKLFDKEWRQEQVLNDPVNDNFLRVCFINSNELIATTKKEGRFYRLSKDSMGFFQVNKSIELNYCNEMYPEQFPIIYNQELKIVICRHGDAIFILTQQFDGDFAVQQILNCNSQAGFLSDNGKILILSDNIYNNIQIWALK